jgi:hypothetical protein
LGEATELREPVQLSSVEFQCEIKVAYCVQMFSNITYCEARSYFNAGVKDKTLEKKIVVTFGEIRVKKGKLR